MFVFEQECCAHSVGLRTSHSGVFSSLARGTTDKAKCPEMKHLEEARRRRAVPLAESVHVAGEALGVAHALARPATKVS